METLEALKRGERYQKPLTKEEIDEVNLHFKPGSPYFEYCLCILQNTSTFLGELENRIIQLMKDETMEAQRLIHLLNIARIHIIDVLKKRGEPLTSSIVEVLKTVLFHPDWEVREWAVRVIDQCDGQKRLFQKELYEVFPRRYQIMFNLHKRHIHGMIRLMLERKEI